MSWFIRLSFLLLMAAKLGADTTAAAPSLRLAVVDLKRIVTESQEGKRIKEKLENEIKSKQQLLNKESEQVRALQQKLEQQGAVMKADARQKLEAELQQKMMGAQQLYAKMQQEMAGMEASALAELSKKVKNVAKEIKGFDAIINEEAVVMASANIPDVTNQILRMMNSIYASPAKSTTSKK